MAAEFTQAIEEIQQQLARLAPNLKASPRGGVGGRAGPVVRGTLLISYAMLNGLHGDA